jgi:hypothetical protein
VIEFGGYIDYETLFAGMTGSEITWTVSSPYASLSSGTGGTVTVTNTNNTGIMIGVIITATYTKGSVTIIDRRSFNLKSEEPPPIPPSMRIKQSSGYVLEYNEYIDYEAVFAGMTESEITWSVSSSYASLSSGTGGTVRMTNTNNSGVAIGVIITATYSDGNVTITDRKSFTIKSQEDVPVQPLPPVPPTLGMKQSSGYVLDFGAGMTFESITAGLDITGDITWSVSSSYAILSSSTGESVTVTNNNTSSAEVGVIITATYEGMSVSRSFKLSPATE